LLKSAARGFDRGRLQTSDFRQIGVSSPDSIQVHHHSGIDGLTIFFLRGLPRAALVLSQTTGRGDGREVKLDPEERIIAAALDEPELAGANEGGARARIEFMPEGDAKVTITISRELVEEARTLDLTTWELFAEALRLAIPGAFELARPLPPTLH
jgi:hypothetical protein